MIKKNLKFVLIVVMLIGIVWSVANFLSIENSAQTPEGERGTWVERPNGSFKCMDTGDLCDITSR